MTAAPKRKGRTSGGGGGTRPAWMRYALRITAALALLCAGILTYYYI